MLGFLVRGGWLPGNVHGRGGLDKMKDLDASLLDGFTVDFCFALVVFVHILNLKAT